jgi:hypothetical protein
MKGTLLKDSKSDEWYVLNFQATLEGPLFQTLPILQEQFNINSSMKPLIELKVGKEVEFEVVEGGKARLL